VIVLNSAPVNNNVVKQRSHRVHWAGTIILNASIAMKVHSRRTNRSELPVWTVPVEHTCSELSDPVRYSFCIANQYEAAHEDVAGPCAMGVTGSTIDGVSSVQVVWTELNSNTHCKRKLTYNASWPARPGGIQCIKLVNKP